MNRGLGGRNTPILGICITWVYKLVCAPLSPNLMKALLVNFTGYWTFQDCAKVLSYSNLSFGFDLLC